MRQPAQHSTAQQTTTYRIHRTQRNRRTRKQNNAPAIVSYSLERSPERPELQSGLHSNAMIDTALEQENMTAWCSESVLKIIAPPPPPPPPRIVLVPWWSTGTTCTFTFFCSLLFPLLSRNSRDQSTRPSPPIQYTPYILGSIADSIMISSHFSTALTFLVWPTQPRAEQTIYSLLVTSTRFHQ